MSGRFNSASPDALFALFSTLVPLIPLEGYHPDAILCYGSAGMMKCHAKDRLPVTVVGVFRLLRLCQAAGPASVSALGPISPARGFGRPLIKNTKSRFFLLDDMPTKPLKTSTNGKDCPIIWLNVRKAIVRQ